MDRWKGPVGTYAGQADLWDVLDTPFIEKRNLKRCFQKPWRLAMRKRVLVVDDEVLIVMDVERMLQDLGMDIVGPAMNLKSALELARTQLIDCAILDINLGDGTFSGPVADVLSQRGIPFAFATGYGSEIRMSDQHNASPRLQKPFTMRGLQQVIQAICP